MARAPAKCRRFRLARNLLQFARFMKQVVLLAVLVGLSACGGRVEDPKPDGSGAGAAAPASSSGEGSGSSAPLPSHPLGDCKPGFNRASNPGRSCNWLTDAGLCFDTNNDACACICPPDKDSVCVSPFYGGDGSATPIDCQ
jgi:hypothetical protein